VAGTRYYTQIIYKEGGGGDHGAAKFLLASDPAPENGSLPAFGPTLSTAIDPALLAKLSLPTDLRSEVGSGGTAGFKARIHQVNQIGANGMTTFIDRAEQQLAGLVDTNAVALAGSVDGVFSQSGIINWNQDAGTGADIGNFRSDSTPAFVDAPIPGIPGIGNAARNTDNIAGEIISYVEFPKAGVYFMGVNSDDGFSVTATDKPPVNNGGLYVTAGGTTKGYYALSGGSDRGGFAKPITAPITGKLVIADPLIADAPLKNAAAIKGNIAVIDRGVVTFSAKTQYALDAGAIGVVIVNSRDADSADGQFPIVMGGGAVGLQAVMVSKPQGALIKATIAAGGDVTASITPDTTPYLGSFNGGRGSSDSVFAFNVAQAGLYPLRLVWFEGGGGANLEWFTVAQDGSKIPVNDRSNPAALKAYQTRTFSSVTVSVNPPAGFSGAPLSNVVINEASRTITADVPAGSEQGYLTISPARVIKSVEIVGGKLVVTY
jgi:hypothetical protein